MRGEKIRAGRKTGRDRGRSRRPLGELLESRLLLTTYTVNVASEFAYPQPYPTTPDPSAPMGLGDAIHFANSHSGADTIAFNIPPSGAQTITLTQALPNILDPVTIDGATQPGFISPPVIGITRSNAATAKFDGLSILSSNVTIKSLAIFGFTGADGIKISGSRVTVQGCNIGVDQSNSAAYANQNGIEIVSGQNNLIGGSSTSMSNESNMISGNTGDGILIGPNALNNTVRGNFIGTDNTGLIGIPNGTGIEITGRRNLIGGDQPGQGNVISGNKGVGIFINGVISSPDSNLIQGNKIGVSGDGTSPLGNSGEGISIFVSDNTTIGGTTSNASNVIGANGGIAGILLQASNNTLIQGNNIGTNAAGATNLGNGGAGIFVLGDGQGTRIGGTLAGAGNVISYNGAKNDNSINVYNAGVDLHQAFSGTDVPILGNSIHDNVGLGIQLSGTGTTQNDPGDPDTGPNGLQNFPVITSASTAAGRTQIIGTLNSTPGTTFLIQFFSNKAADDSGYGEGAALLGSTTVTTDGSGNAKYNVILPNPSTTGYSVTATATKVNVTSFGGTSEFSQGVAVVQGKVTDLNVSVSGPSVGTAGTDLRTFTPQVVDWKDGSGVPTTGTGLVVVGIDDDGLLHVRIFDSSGNLATDTDESKLPASDASAIAALKQEITGLLPPHTLTTVEGNKLLTDVAALVEPYVTYTATVTNNGPDDATNVQLTMTLPGGYVPDVVNDPGSLSATQGTVSLTTGQVLGNLGTIAAGKSVTVTLKVLPTAAGTITTSVSATDDEIDTDTSNNTNKPVTTTIFIPSDLSMTISPVKDPAILGQREAFVVLVTNNGPGTATGVTLNVDLPANATFVGASAGQGTVPTPADTNLVANLGTLGRGVTVAVRIVVMPTDSSPLAISGSLSFDQIDTDTSNNSASTSVSTVKGTDVSVSLAPNQPAALSGQTNFAFVATVTNNGPNTADGVTVTFPIPANSTFDSASSPWTVSPDGQTVQVNVGSLEPGSHVQVSFFVVPSASGTLSASASVSADPSTSGDTNPENNQATAQALIDASDLGISQSALPSPAQMGQVLTYSLAVSNNGPADASGVVVTDQLPGSVQFVSGTAGNGGSVQYDANTHIVTITIGSVAAGTSVPISLKVLPTSSTTLTNSATVLGDLQDQDQTNNSTSLTTEVSPADLAVSVSSDASGLVVAGNQVTYTVVVTNNGPSMAPSVQFTQGLPANSRFVSAHSSQGSVSLNNGQITGNLGDLGAHGTATVTLVVVPLASGQAVSTASVSSSLMDTDSSNNQGSASANVTNQPGTVQIASQLYQAGENSGYAAITLTRTNGTQGSVSVVYSTIADGSARPGINFTPVSQIITFADGETSKTVFVPVQSDGTYEPYTFFHVALTSPSGGVTIGSQSSTIVAVMNTDVDTTPLVVANTTLIASGPVISGVQLTFNKPLNPALASSLGNFFLIGPNGVGIPTYQPIYNGSNNSVTIVPASPLVAPGFYTVVVNGAANGLTDYHGTVLDGNGDGIAGGNFIESFARGPSLIYGDATGNLVSLSLSRGGLLEMFRDASGNSKALNVFAPPTGRSVLSGSVFRYGPSATGSTNLGQVSGLSLGGPVRSALTTPPFYATSQVNNVIATTVGPHRRLRGRARIANVPLPRWFHRTI